MRRDFWVYWYPHNTEQPRTPVHIQKWACVQPNLETWLLVLAGHKAEKGEQKKKRFRKREK